jgi:hypothetical protein
MGRSFNRSLVRPARTKDNILILTRLKRDSILAEVKCKGYQFLIPTLMKFKRFYSFPGLEGFLDESGELLEDEYDECRDLREKALRWMTFAIVESISENLKGLILGFLGKYSLLYFDYAKNELMSEMIRVFSDSQKC